MEISVLGPLEVRRGGDVVPLGAPKLRALLLSLVLELGRVVHAERLIEELWADDPPPQPLVSLRSYVSNLRRVLQDPAGAPVIATRAGGYVLDVPAAVVDAVRFEHAVAEGGRLLEDGDPNAAFDVLTTALALWRGTAFADVADEAHVRPTVTKLDELRNVATEDRLDALLALGRHREAIPELEAFVAVQPLRERPHRQLMLALYRAGRAPDALRVSAEHRDELVTRFGLDPSPELGALTDRILRQDPGLDPPSLPPPRSPVGAATVDLAAALVTSSTGTGPALDDVTSLVGRDHERATVRRAVADVVEGRGGVLLVAGEPGIGKSALLAELRRVARASGVPVAGGRCLEQQGTPAYWPWLEIVRSATDGLGRGALAPLLAGAAGPVTQLLPELAARADVDVVAAAGDPDHARFVLHTAVGSLLRSLASSHGLVVLVDDLHWADPATLELFGLLATWATSDRVLLVAAYRDAATERSPELDAAVAVAVREPATRTLPLRPLAPEEVGELVARVTGRPVEGEVRDEVVRRSDGNPFFAHQLAVLLEDDARSGAGPTIPLGVRHVLLRRLQVLPDAVQDTLRTAAVLGQAFDVRHVATVTERSTLEVLDDVDVAIGHGLVEVDTEDASAYAFVHALVRETLYDELPKGRAARDHLAAADLLATLDRPAHAAIAEHLWRAGDAAPAERTVEHLRAAADEAIGVLALQQAERLLGRALQLLGRGAFTDTRTELAVRLRLVQVQTMVSGWTHPDRAASTERVRELVGREGLDPEVVPLFWSLWSTSMTRGDLTTATALAAELLDAAQRLDDPASVVAGAVASAYTGVFAGEGAAQLDAWLDAASAAEADAPPDRLAATPEHLGVGLRATRAIRAGVEGDEETALAAGASLVEHADDVGTAFQTAYARLFAAWSAALVDRPDRAGEHSEVGLATAEACGYASVRGLLLPIDAWARARRGEGAATQAERLRQALDVLRAAGQWHAVGHWSGLLAEVAALAGQDDEASAALEHADEVAARTGERVYGRQLARIRAEVRARRR